MATITLKCEIKWFPETADGCRCDICGDLIFMSQYTLFMRVVPAGKWQRLNQVSCQSCADCFRDNVESGDA